MSTKLDDRQVVQRAALSTSIGTSVNTTLDSVFSTIDSKMVNLNGTQTLSGKTLSFLQTSVTTDSTTTGASATLQAADITTGVVRLTNTSLVSISGIPAGAAGQKITIENQTGNPIGINNSDSGVTAANRIITGYGTGVTLSAGQTFDFVYDATAANWMLLGGAGAGTAIFPVDFSGTQSSQAVTANTTDITFSVTKDSNAAWSGTQYVVKLAGDYLVAGSAALSAQGALQVYKNGTGGGFFSTNTVSGGASSGCVLLPNLKVGDTISLRCTSSVTVTVGTISVVQVQGVATTSTGQVIAASVYASTNVTASHPLIFNTVIYDTTSSYSTSTGLYTCPVAGYYQVSGNFGSTGTPGVGLYKNGSLYSVIANPPVAGQIIAATAIIQCNAGDTLSIGNASSQTWLGNTLNGTSQVSRMDIQLLQGPPAQSSSSSSSGGGGSKNYLSAYTASTSSGVANTGNGNFELASTTGWSLGTTGTLTNGIPTGTPNFGSGASGNLSIAVVNSGQIGGKYSLSYASSAATTAGNCLASDAFFIDNEDQAKLLGFSFYYKAQSNSANANWSSSSSASFMVAAWDVTNSSWLQITPNPWQMTQGSGVGLATGYFQTNPTTTQIRFIVYNSNATSGAVTIYFDDFVVTPVPINQIIGPVIASYNTTGNSVGTSVTQISFANKLVDTTASYSAGSFTCPQSGYYSVSATIRTSTASYTAPGGFVAWVYKNGSVYARLGTSVVSANVSINLVASGTQIVPCNAGDTLAIYAVSDTATTLSSTATDNTFSVSQVQSAGVGPAGQVVAAKLNTLSSTSLTANTAPSFTTVEFDTSGALSGGNKFTCPVSGWYQVSVASINTSSSSGRWYVAKNGSFSITAANTLGSLITSSTNAAGYTVIQCNANDTLQVAFDTTLTVINSLVNVTFTLVQGPSAQTSTPTVAASYWVSANFAASTTVPINFDSKEFDTTNSVTTSSTAWKFVAPSTGTYQVSVIGGSATASGSFILYKNGSAYKPLMQYSTAIYGAGTTVLKLNSQDFIDVRPGASVTISGGTLNNSNTANISILRVGN